jgi:hypothetical protein
LVKRHRASVIFENQAVNDHGVWVKSIASVTAPITIETEMLLERGDDKFAFAGVCLTDGTGTGSNEVSCVVAFDGNNIDAAIRGDHGTVTSMTGAAAVSLARGDIKHAESVLLRLINTAANTFKIGFSIDGVSWLYTGTFAKTITPTHMGFALTEWGGGAATEHLAAFEFIRRTDSDLSV